MRLHHARLKLHDSLPNVSEGNQLEFPVNIALVPRHLHSVVLNASVYT